MPRQGEGFGHVGADAWRQLPPVVKLVVRQEGKLQRTIELDAEHKSAIKSVRVDSTWDGAAILKVAVRCDTPDRRVLFRDEAWLQHPQVVDVWAGYGTPDKPMGRFYMKRAPFVNDVNGITGTLIGYDALERMMGHKAPRLLKGYDRTSDVVQLMADEYGLLTEIDASEPMKPDVRVTKRRRRRRKKDPSAPKGYRIVRKVEKVTEHVLKDHHKPAGDTDVRFLKLMAAGNDHLNPYVRLVGTIDAPREVFHWVRPMWERQKLRDDVQRLTFAQAGGHNTIQRFSPTWSVAGLPTAVRVTMFVDGRWVTVQREISEATGHINPAGTTLAVSATPPGFNPKVAQFDTSKAPDPKAAYVEVLTSAAVKEVGGGSRRGKGRRRGKRASKSPKKEVWGRDVAVVFQAPGGGMNPVEYADAWLLTRAQLGINGPCRMQNVVGSQHLLANTVHAVVGVGARDSGWYIIHRAQHSWTFGEGGGHSVMCALERQAGRLELE